ncbi:DNA-binding transcriptional activator BglJ [Pigmentiphaga humi]|uniref:DNA-binding transcriptional activator BglJ n=1 Tax=Pigmentiphaga humi TaxID=2478468 RepID=A0A3P4B5S4_9BURK|nr:LuxR C-terminal-related transcriptional regulator [Pigmentiphaga humi]VCU70515.1 DNA-binding transcriptional activator BglJ [Pigmentiphaga humi]
MDCWLVDAGERDESVRGLPWGMRAAAALGDHALPAAMLAEIQAWGPVQHLSIIDRRLDGGGCTLEAASISGNGAYQAGMCYVSKGFYRFDSVDAVMRGSPSSCAMVLQSSHEVAVAEYRARCYEDLAIAQRCTLATASEGRAISLNLYRCVPNGGFAEREIESMRHMAADLLMLVSKHRLIARLRAMAEPRLRYQRLSATLSERERQVLARCCHGWTAKQIARELRLEVSTVNTYKNRACQRLGIRGQRGLLELLGGNLDELEQATASR